MAQPAQARRMARLVQLVACLVAAASLHSLAFAPGGRVDAVQRRMAIMLVALPGEAMAASTAPSKWAGRWSDPDAPGCKREIVMSFDGTKGRLMGAESVGMNPGLTAAEMAREKRVQANKPGCSRGDALKFWEARLSAPGKDSDELTIDLSKSGLPGPKSVQAKWDGSGIVFPDGTKWTRGGGLSGGRGS
ncbi:unnamed protein product [Effrenium voratum]|nr:unnamed protein product [Effrenium voratum]CAJ1434693.1 unnamed protein product [Effrenium voratum]